MFRMIRRRIKAGGYRLRHPPSPFWTNYPSSDSSIKVFPVSLSGNSTLLARCPGSASFFHYFSLLRVDSDSSPSAIRRISTQDRQWRAADNPALTCGPGAQPAQHNLPVQAGDTLGFSYKYGDPDTPWIYGFGPVLTYLADCGSAPCSEFNSSGAQWFKIYQLGRKDDGEGGITWYQQDLMKPSEQLATVKIPENLAAGNYLLRHEAIWLHIPTGGPTSFFPTCIQITVNGTGTGRPQQTDLAQIPGPSYSDEEGHGLYVKDILRASVPYTVFPGPQIASFINGGAITTSAGRRENFHDTPYLDDVTVNRRRRGYVQRSYR